MLCCVAYQRFRGSCCLHLQVMTPCSDVAGHRIFGGPCRLRLQVLTPCSNVVGYPELNIHRRGDLKSRICVMNPVLINRHWSRTVFWWV